MRKGIYGYANKDRRYTRGWFQKNSGSILKSFLLKVSLSTLELAVIKTKDRYCPASFKFCLGWSSFNSPLLYFVDLFQLQSNSRVSGPCPNHQPMDDGTWKVDGSSPKKSSSRGPQTRKNRTSTISFQVGFILPRPILSSSCFSKSATSQTSKR